MSSAPTEIASVARTKLAANLLQEFTAVALSLRLSAVAMESTAALRDMTVALAREHVRNVVSLWLPLRRSS